MFIFILYGDNLHFEVLFTTLSVIIELETTIFFHLINKNSLKPCLISLFLANESNSVEESA